MKLLYVFILSLSLYTGYLVGYNEGWDTGVIIGGLNAKFNFHHYENKR